MQPEATELRSQSRWRELAVVSLIANFAILSTANAELVEVYSEDFENGTADGLTLDRWWVEFIENQPGPTNSFSERLPQLGSRFLRTITSTVDETVILQLNNLPPHDSVTIDLDFLTMDSPDSEFFVVTLDGVDVFRERIWPRLPLAFPGSNIIDVTLLHQEHLGYNGGTSGPTLWQAESAFDMGALPAFKDIAHTSDSLTLEILSELDGPDQFDESFAIDNLVVSVNLARADPRLTDLSLELDGQITLQWDSIATENYAISVSTDLTNWGDAVNEGIISQGASTTVTIPNPLPNADNLYFRIEDLSPQ